MHQPTRDVDGGASAATDVVLAAALLGVLLAAAWGVIFVQGAAAAEEPVALWLGCVPPAVTGACGAVLLRLRGRYPGLPRLCRFLTRAGTLGVGAAGLLVFALAVLAAR